DPPPWLGRLRPSRLVTDAALAIFFASSMVRLTSGSWITSPLRARSMMPVLAVSGVEGGGEQVERADREVEFRKLRNLVRKRTDLDEALSLGVPLAPRPRGLSANQDARADPHRGRAAT